VREPRGTFEFAVSGGQDGLTARAGDTVLDLCLGLSHGQGFVGDLAEHWGSDHTCGVAEELAHNAGNHVACMFIVHAKKC